MIRMSHQGLKVSSTELRLDQHCSMGRVLSSQEHPHPEDECRIDEDAKMNVWAY